MTYPAYNIALWRDLCAWLEAQPYNAAYTERIPARFVWLLASPRNYPAYQYGEEKHRMAKAAAMIRQDYGIVYWSTGYGWRLHKNYRQDLELLEEDWKDQ